ncbi:hypothetical protein PV05_06818 [Exophiala xenobiotica]|uniref:Major facilitator superfamily (MFS) profile domain-containing protein n=1 Tax=Exophiala xenobiotica TaxID=348802 RepID=A0A0D2CWE8_9EURO|nr:uncharacterized protein PV05_06818 [Exophiala xenobiotica]KIW54462.1 hypothetical protein PV05_06818 [Exophiala xenobiotica]
MSSDAERQVSGGGEDEARHEKHESHNDSNLESVAAFESPFDFPAWRKWTMTTLLGGMAAAVTFGSSVWSSTIPVTTKQFDVSESVAVLGVSLYVLGFAFGPIVWGPLSELKGRRLPMFSGFFIWALLQIPVGVANNLPTILVCRLLAGCFGAAPMALISAVYADFWMPAERGTATAVYSAAVYIGPTLGPIFGSLLTESSLGWHWTAWLTLIMGAGAGIPAFLFVPETYGPVLQARANRKARLANDGGFPHEDGNEQSPTFQIFVRKYMVKPIKMLCFEPMLIVMTLYISIVYGILYLTFYAFPYSFAEGRGWDPRVASLPFLSILVSVLVASVGVAWYSREYYRPRLRARGSVLPEDRLPPIMLGSVLLPAGLFWFGWCSSSHISPVPQIIAGLLIGSGIMLIFTNGVAYIVDIYLESAASALAVNTCCRSLVAAGFPLAAPRMYRHMGVPWATSVLGFLCVLLVPAPILFYKYGRRLRQMSRYAPTPR